MADQSGETEPGAEFRDLAKKELERELLQDDIAAARQRWREARDSGDRLAETKARKALDELMDRRSES